MKEDGVHFKEIHAFRKLRIDYIKLEHLCNSYTVYRQSFDAIVVVIAFMNGTLEETINHCKRLVFINSDYDTVTRKSLDRITAVIYKVLNASHPNVGDLFAAIIYLRCKVDNVFEEMQRKKPLNVTFLFESQRDILIPLNDLEGIRETFNLDIMELKSYKLQVEHIMKTWLNIYRLFKETVISSERHFLIDKF